MTVLSETYTPKPLFAGDFPVAREEAAIASGQILSAGSVLGKITLGDVAAAAGANTGGETVGSLSKGSKAKPGAYKLKCAAAGAAGTFAVIDPDGIRLADAAVGTAYASNEINFTLAAAGANSAVGDSFTITVAEGSGEYKLRRFVSARRLPKPRRRSFGGCRRVRRKRGRHRRLYRRIQPRRAHFRRDRHIFDSRRGPQSPLHLFERGRVA